ncbi:uncharacterized protein [Drosophila tropicalis]|uniref:uncharacterized protein n=1 Tax=Drosophila tropicalis TaxID=46794 RepID=UPI0035AB6AA7
MNQSASLFMLLSFILSLLVVNANFEFTNIKCTPLDEEFATFEYCYLKSVNRTYKYMSLKVNLLKSPVTKVKVNANFEFTNIKCTPLDEEFATFKYCYLKSLNRTYKYMSLKVNLLKSPVTKVKVNVALMQRLSGYKPFLYNVTVDACNLMANYKSANPVTKYLHGLFKPFSNMNHTCPYNQLGGSSFLNGVPSHHPKYGHI